MLSVCLVPCPLLGPGVGKGVKRVDGEKESPGAPPTAHACPFTNMYMHTHFCTQTHFPPFLLPLFSSQFHSSLSSFSHSLSSFPLLFLVSSFICFLFDLCFCSPFFSLSLLFLPSLLPPSYVCSASHHAFLHSPSPAPLTHMPPPYTLSFILYLHCTFSRVRYV